MSRFALSLALVISALMPALALGHAERPVEYPDPAEGSVPKYRTSGPKLVVCKQDSESRIRRIFSGRRGALRDQLALLERCDYRNVQDAVADAKNGHRIMVLPGKYRERPSRRVPTPDPACEDMYTEPLNTGTSLGAATPGNLFGEGVASGMVPSYEHHRECPASFNLITIAGDGPDDNITCEGRNEKCNLQIEGTGLRPGHVKFIGTRKKFNIFRADRADGIGFYNFSARYSDFNNLYVVETNGFRFEDIVSRYSYEYGFLSFVADNGLYKDLVASHSGDSGVYPGSGPQRADCGDYGIKLTGINAHHNLLGYSGTAGDSVDVKDSRFHHNVVGISTDSFIGGHPGLPQDCSRFRGNEIYSNNFNLFTAKRDELCGSTPSREQPRRSVCPTFAAPLGTGIMIAAGNGNVVTNNLIYDNWREGVKLFWVPAAARGDLEPQVQYDTSHDNRFTDNEMGVTPDGEAAPNGLDFWWDEEGSGNCWSDNVGFEGAEPTSDPPRLLLPECPDLVPFRSGNQAKTAQLAPCATFDQRENRDPVGCDWVVKPEDPSP